MNQHLERRRLLVGLQPPVTELSDQRLDRPQDVSVRILRHRLVGVPFVDVEVVPRLRMGVLGPVAGIVHPVGVVDGRTAVQHLFDPLGRLGREVAFGDVRHDVVAFLAPCQQALGRQQTADEKQEFFHGIGTYSKG